MRHTVSFHFFFLLLFAGIGGPKTPKAPRVFREAFAPGAIPELERMYGGTVTVSSKLGK
jgi:hypothetical protein